MAGVEMGRYYIDYRRAIGEDFSGYMFDPEGVPLVHHRETSRWYYNPVTIAQYGLKIYNLLLTVGDPHRRDLFLGLSRRLLKMGERGAGGSLVWYYRIPLPLYRVNPPWISGMAQGLALSVLLRAYTMTGDGAFLEAAAGARRSFDLKVNEGGVRAIFPDGGLVFEEVPSHPPSCILNGFIFALFGLYDYWLVTGDKRSHGLFERGVNSLKENLPRYDTGFWSLYDLWSPPRLASYQYHTLHIEQLKVLHGLTGKDELIAQAERMARYRREFKSLFRWLTAKVGEKLARKFPQHRKSNEEDP